MRLLCLTAAALSLVAASAAAETSQQRAACLVSVVRLCPTEVLHGDRTGAKSCLLRNLSSASAPCQAVVRAELQAEAAGKPPSA